MILKKNLILLGLISLLFGSLVGCVHLPPVYPAQAEWQEIPRATSEVTLTRYIDIGRITQSAENEEWLDTYILVQDKLSDEDEKSLVFSITADCYTKAVRVNELFIYPNYDAAGEVSQIFPMSGQFYQLDNTAEIDLLINICTD